MDPKIDRYLAFPNYRAYMISSLPRIKVSVSIDCLQLTQKPRIPRQEPKGVVQSQGPHVQEGL